MAYRHVCRRETETPIPGTKIVSNFSSATGFFLLWTSMTKDRRSLEGDNWKIVGIHVIPERNKPPRDILGMSSRIITGFITVPDFWLCRRAGSARVGIEARITME